MRRGTPAAEKFGLLIKSLREANGQSMNQLANELGVYPAAVSQVEKAQRVVKADKIALWAEALNVEALWLDQQWQAIDLANPDEPIRRYRGKSVEQNELFEMIETLIAPERERVRGYIEAILEQRD